jgi:hypothetical protein
MAAATCVWGMTKPKMRLRWRFDFFDGKPPRCGIWNNSGARDSDGAWCVNKTGLRRAAIEGENCQTWETETLWECDGPDFVNFEWMVAAPMGMPFGNGEMTIKPTILGLAGVSRDFKDEVFIDGSARRRTRTDEEKKNILAAWSK